MSVEVELPSSWSASSARTLWPLLIGYAVLPWLVVVLGGIEKPDVPACPLRVPVLLVLGSLSARARAWHRRWSRSRWPGGVWGVGVGALLAACVAGANAPWIVGDRRVLPRRHPTPSGAFVFATADEGLMAAPVAALSFGGVWNAEVVPGSRLVRGCGDHPAPGHCSRRRRGPGCSGRAQATPEGVGHVLVRPVGDSPFSARRRAGQWVAG